MRNQLISFTGTKSCFPIVHIYVTPLYMLQL